MESIYACIYVEGGGGGGSDFLLIDLQYNCMLDYLVVDKVEEVLKKLSSSGTDDNMLIRHDNI